MVNVAVDGVEAAGFCDADRLLELIRAGDRSALDAATRCFGERLVAVGRRYCKDRDDADDAVQDAWVAAGEHLGSFRGDGSLEGWLVRLVVNACHRMRRGRKNEPKLHLTEVELTGGDDDPELLAARGQMIARLGEALLVLRPQDRAMVLLSEAEGWTGPEIGEALALSPVAVRSRLTRARRKLRGALGVA